MNTVVYTNIMTGIIWVDIHTDEGKTVAVTKEEFDIWFKELEGD